jgi:ribonuclease D
MLENVTLLEGDLPNAIAAELGSEPTIACDIETSGLDWRKDKIGTCQLFTPSTGAVILKVWQSIPERLKALLESEKVEKVFHHAPFDLRFMLFSWNVHVSSVTCTKVASRIAFPDFPSEEHSLKPLLQRYLGVNLDKSEQQSDWINGELNDRQLSYAAEDVRYLIPLKQCLEAEIRKKGLDSLYKDCLKFLPSRVQLEVGGWPDVFKY